jgi:predicted heme/steroid binding protein
MYSMSHSLNKIIVVISVIIILSMFLVGQSIATPEYSSGSGQSCKTCHLDSMGGKLTDRGLEFSASGYVWPPKGGYRVIGPIKKPVRLLIGYIHILSAFIWFGTILYVHLILKPAYAEKGLPKGEVKLGAVSMGLVGLTGILLMLSRIKGLDILFSTPWGITLSVKIFFYTLMVSSAIFIVTFIGKKLRKPDIRAKVPANGVFDPVTLSAFNGKDEKPAFISYNGKVYDVTGLKLWSKGQHMKHLAGGDMTSFLPKAPHGDEKLADLKVVGTFDDSLLPPKTIHQRIFTFIAYMNLSLVFVVLLVISVWRWGL